MNTNLAHPTAKPDYFKLKDPMPSTVEDFWRMVLEHNISTMVMLSADCAWNYWEEEKEAKFGAIKVKLNSTEKLPCYVKREFSIYNEKVGRELGYLIERTLTLFK